MKLQRKASAMLVLSMLIFGSIGIFRRYIALPSGVLALARGLLGGVFLLLFSALRGKKQQKLAGKQAALLVLSGALMGLNWMLLFEAYNYTTVSAATLLYYMQPTIVILLSPLLFRERLTAKKTVCAAAALGGMVLVSGILRASTGSGSDLRGIACGLGAAALYAAVVIINKSLREIDSYQKTTIQLFSAAVTMIPYVLLTGELAEVSFTAQTLGMVLVVGIVHTGLAYALYFGSMEHLKAQTIAILSYIDPASALVFAAVFLHETMTLSMALGAVMILAAATVSETEKSAS